MDLRHAPDSGGQLAEQPPEQAEFRRPPGGCAAMSSRAADQSRSPVVVPTTPWSAFFSDRSCRCRLQRNYTPHFDPAAASASQAIATVAEAAPRLPDRVKETPTSSRSTRKPAHRAWFDIDRPGPACGPAPGRRLLCGRQLGWRQPARDFARPRAAASRDPGRPPSRPAALLDRLGDWPRWYLSECEGPPCGRTRRHARCSDRDGVPPSRRHRLARTAVASGAARRGSDHRDSLGALGRRRVLRPRARCAGPVGVALGWLSRRRGGFRCRVLRHR